VATAVSALLVLSSCVPGREAPDRPSVLLFTRTQGFHHESIGPASQALTTALEARGDEVSISDDPAVVNDDELRRFAVVVFLETTGDVLDDREQAALQQWVQSGGGWVGVHSALDTEYDWPFYEELAGTWFASHPAVQPATVRREDPSHPAMVDVPDAWVRTDEWYNTRTDPRPAVHVLATVDETTYQGGTMGADHPIEWCRRIGDGQSFVTAMGHTDESWADPTFVDHVVKAIESVTEPGTCR
jgi:type 1 glutamine amidotransferase